LRQARARHFATSNLSILDHPIAGTTRFGRAVMISVRLTGELGYERFSARAPDAGLILGQNDVKRVR